MDEGDAALDKTNVRNIIRFIQSQTNTMQFIVITFQKLLQFDADALIGITVDVSY
jgi:chromosome segregation ATPase